jgi:hypothetical protein
MFVTGVTPSSDAPFVKLLLVLVKGKIVNQCFGCLPCYKRRYCELSSVLSGQLLIRCDGGGPGVVASVNCLNVWSDPSVGRWRLVATVLAEPSASVCRVRWIRCRKCSLIWNRQGTGLWVTQWKQVVLKGKWWEAISCLGMPAGTMWNFGNV